MKSSLLALVVVSSLALTGCFRSSSESCSSCVTDMNDQMPCATCPSELEMAEAEAGMEDGVNEPMMEEMIEVSEK